MKKIFTNQLILLVALLTASVTANAGSSHDTHYGQVTVSANPASGAGTVYLSDKSGASSGNTSATFNCGGSESSDSKTYYLYATTTNNNYYFDGWYDGSSRKNTNLSYSESFDAKSTKSGSPTSYSRVAKWIAKTSPLTTTPSGKSSLTYTGSAQALLNAGTAATGCTLQYSSDGTNWSSSIPTGTNAGNYTVYYKATGDSKHLNVDKTSISVTIAKAALTVTANDESVTYGDATPSYSVAYSGWKGSDSESVLGGTLAFACSYAAGSAVGEYAITPSGLTANNYNITFTAGKLTVGKAALSVTANNESITYGDAAPSYSVAYSGWKGSDSESVLGGTLAFACSYAAGSAVGEYTITPSGLTAGNYNITFNAGKLTVGKAALSVTANDESIAYGDAAPAYSVAYSGWKGSDSESVLSGALAFACDYTAGKGVGEYTITPSGLTAGNYEITFNAGKLTVGKAALSITANDESITYGDDAPTYSVAYSGWKGSDSESVLSGELALACEYAAGNGVGEYAITPSGVEADNYEITFNAGKLTVGKAALSVTANDESITYGDDAPTYSVAYSGWKGSDDESVLGGELALACTYTVGSGVGEYAITPSGLTADNYEITFNAGKLTVGKAALSITADDKNIFYGEDAPTYTATIEGWKAEDDQSVLDGTLAFACDYVTGNSVGTYAITPSGVTADNYDITFNAGTLHVNKPAAVVTTAPVAVTGLVYTTAAQTLINADDADVTGGSLVYSLDGENFSADLPEATNAKTYTVSYYVKADADHSDTEVQTIEVTIAAAALTITAENKETTYGQDAPAFTVAYSDFAGTEDESVLGGELAFDCEYAAGSDVNTFDITPKGLTSGNYDITFVAGTLTVNKAALTVTAKSQTIAYGDEVPEYDVEFDGFVLEQDKSVLGGELAFNCDYAQGSTAADYDITPEGLTSGNYEITFQKGTLTVTNAKLTVKADDKLIDFGAEAPAYTATVEGWKLTDDNSKLSKEVEFTCEYAQGDNAGSYTIAPVEDVTATNYDIEFVTGTLTVSKIAAEVVAPTAVAELAYTGVAQTLIEAGSATGGEIQYALADDDESYSTALPEATNAGTYTVYFRVIGDANHNNIDAASVEVTIAKINAVLSEAPTAAENLQFAGVAQDLLATAGVAEGGEIQYSLDGENFAAALPTATNAGDYTVSYKVVGDQNHNDVAVATLTVSIAKVDATLTSAPTGKDNLSYTGDALELLATAGVAEGGEIQYSLTGEDFAAALPTATAAGEYTVYYMVVGDQNHNDVEAATLAVSIAKTDAAVISAPTGKADLTYTGEAQELLATTGEVEGGIILYSLDGENFATDLPTATDAGEYTVSFRITADANHNDLEEAGSVVVTIAKANSVITTHPAGIENLAYTGEDQELVTAGVAEGGTILYKLGAKAYSDELPKATNADEYTILYKVKGDSNHKDISYGGMLTVTIAKADVVFDPAPAAVEGLVFTGEAQELVTAGEAKGVTVQYALGDGEFAPALPTATNAGDYTIYYKVPADDNHNAFDATSIAVSIAKADVKFITKPAAIPGLVVTDEEQVLITAGEVEGGELQYALGDGEFSTALPKGIGLGNYTIRYRVIADANHNDVEPVTIIARIAAGKAVLVAAPEAVAELVYTGNAQTLVSAGSAAGGELWYSIDGETFSAELPTAANAGEYTVSYYVHGDEDHADAAGGTVVVTIAKADAELTAAPQAVENLIYNGEAQVLVVAGTNVGGTLEYSLDGETFAAELPTATDADSYAVYYRVAEDNNYNGIAMAEQPVEVVIAKAEAELTAAPAAVENLVYNGEGHVLVVAGVNVGGTLEYSLNGEDFAAELPTATDADTYTVYYRVNGGKNYTDIAPEAIEATIAKADAELTDAPVAAEGLVYNGDAQVLVVAGTTVGGTLEYSLDGENFAAELPTATDADTYAVYYRINGGKNYNDKAFEETVEAIIAKAELTITTAPAAEELVYNGEAQALVAAGQATAGTFEYALDGGEFAAELPSATNAGTYTVTYRVNGGQNYLDVEGEEAIEVTIGKADATLVAPTAAEGLAYTGEAQALLATAGEATGGTLEYSLNGEDWSAEQPTATDIDTYTVYYRVTGDDNHNDIDAATLTVEIAPARAIVTTAPAAVEGLVFTGDELTLITAGEADGGEMQYALADGEFSTELPKATNAGEYTVSYRVVGDETHSDVEAATITVTIAKADAELTLTPEVVENLVADGTAQALVTAGEAKGGELLFSLNGEDWSAELPTATEAGEYTVFFYVAGDDNHNNTEVAQLEVVIAASTATGVEDAKARISVIKIIRDDKVFIIRDGKTYSATGLLAE